MPSTQCFDCGMAVSGPRCLKCDAVIADQTDGSTLWIDIAHQGETVKIALTLMEQQIREARHGLAQYVGLIVGNGRIREEALMRLRDLEFRQDIVGIKTSDSNRGQILVQIRS